MQFKEPIQSLITSDSITIYWDKPGMLPFGISFLEMEKKTESKPYHCNFARI